MATLQEVKDELAARCRRISGLRCYGEMSPRPDAPALCVHGPTSWAYDQTMDEAWLVHLQLWVYVNPTDPMRAQQSLDSYMAPAGTKSIRSAVYGDAVTPDLIESVRVIGGTAPYGLVAFESGVTLFGAAVEVEVYIAV